VGGFWVTRLDSTETAGKEEGVLKEAVVEVIIYLLPQLGRHAGRRGGGHCRHSGTWRDCHLRRGAAYIEVEVGTAV
jgi:hypothetical protein